MFHYFTTGVSAVVFRVFTRLTALGAVAFRAAIAIDAHYVAITVAGELSWDPSGTEYITSSVSTIVLWISTRHFALGTVAHWAEIAIDTHYVPITVTGELS